MIGLFGRWSCKGHTGKPLLICSSHLGDGTHSVNKISLLGIWSCKGVHH